MARSTAVTRAKTTEIADIQAELKKQAMAMSERVGPSSNSSLIKVTPMGFRIAGSVAPAPMNVVILDFISRNVYYEGRFDADNIQPPGCFAQGFGRNGGRKELDQLVPHEQSADKQAETCAMCPNNDFQTAENGKGKACKNRRILAVLPPDNIAPDDEIWLLDMSPSSLSDFDNYVDSLKALHELPPIAFITELQIKPAGGSVAVTFGKSVPNPNVAAHFARQAEAKALLERIPPNFLAGPPTPVTKPTRRTRKTAA